MGYIEQILWAIAKTTFSKRTFCNLLIGIISLILRTHIDGIISFVLTTNYVYVDFVMHIIISSILIIKSKYFYDIVNRYEPEFYALVRFLINNYTVQNFKRWKRNLNLILCIYVYILTYFLHITNEILRQVIIEYIICYFLLEFYDKYNMGKFKNQDKEFEFSKDDDITTDLKENDNFDKELFDIKKS